MKKLFLILGVIVSVIVLVLGTIIFVSILRFLNPNLDQKIMGPGVVSSSWLEITPKEPLRADRVVQQVVLYVDKPVTHPRDSWELILPDGSKVIPEVQVVDQDGKVYHLTDPSRFTKVGSREAFQMEFGARELPNDKVYRTVRIRSEKPFNVSEIVWRCYDPRDLP